MLDNEPETEVARRTQARILDAANAAIAKVGYERLRMEAVARGSGITRQTIYNYFATKSQLVVAVLLREGALVNERAKANIPPDVEGEDLVAESIIALVDSARSNPIFSGMFEGSSIGYVNELAEHSEVIARLMHQYWSPMLGRLEETGDLRNNADTDRVEWWLSFVYRAMLLRPADELNNREEMASLIKEFVAPSLIVKGERAGMRKKKVVKLRQG